MLYLVNTKTREIIRNDDGSVKLFSTNNAACNYAGALGIPCWVESQVYNPGLNRRK
jgi:hypothetical protein